MSANRQRIASAVRSLALTPEERRQLLGDSKNKGGKAGSAGVGTSEAEESRLCCDGSTSSNANPGTGERDPDSGGQEGGLDATDPAKLDMGDGTLSGVTDCATGEPVCFDGSGFIPPDGWDEPTSPPALENYEEGKYWYTTGTSNTQYGQTPRLTAEKFVSNFGNGSCDDSHITKEQEVSQSRWDYEFQGPCGSGSFIVISGSCDDDYNAVCDEAAPTVDSWPSDGCTNLAIKGGKIVGSKYDPENDGSYSAPRDSIQLCDGSSSILMQPLPGGGFRTIESASGSAVSGAVGYIYSADNKLVGTITQAEWDATSP